MARSRQLAEQVSETDTSGVWPRPWPFGPSPPAASELDDRRIARLDAELLEARQQARLTPPHVRRRVAAHLRERELRSDRREDVQTRRARGLRARSEPELVHHLLDDERDLAHELPRIALARVEVDQQVVRPLDVLHARVPGMQLDA